MLHIVEGVTKISKIPFSSSEERQAENFRKLLLAMVDDIRVILVKLADRLHNMRTLQYLPDERRERIARETMDIYAPLAGRLGMSKIKNELEDLAFQYLEPEALPGPARRGCESRREPATAFIEKIKRDARREAEGGRHRGRDRRPHQAPLLDLPEAAAPAHRARRRSTTSWRCAWWSTRLADCYAALGVIHNLWRPVPGPHQGLHRHAAPERLPSLHTSVIGDEGQPFEVQIRTREMHRVAEEGIAAHWKYKEGRSRPRQGRPGLRLAAPAPRVAAGGARTRTSS